MSLLLKHLLAANNRLPNRYKKLLSGLALSLCYLSSGIQSAQAEGSRTLYPSSASASSSRANLEWRTDTYGGLVLRRTLLKVYANKDEYILLGSSAVGVNNGNIRVYNPGRVSGSIGSETVPNTPDFVCTSQAGRGVISTRQQELNGPRAISGGGNPNGYIPCYYQAPSTGIYDIVFYGPDGGSSSANGAPTGEMDLSNGNNFNAQQGTSVAAWDVTVRSSNQTSTTDLNGRLFSYYLALFTGNNGRYLNFPVYPVTTDGYRYKVELRGTDPNGFVLYGNQTGFFDSDGKSPLYHDILGADSQLANPQGGVSLARPQYATFFNSIDTNVLSSVERYKPDGTSDGTGIPLSPIIPVVTNLQFNGTVTGNNSSFGTGGALSFASNVTGTYELIISRDGTNFDPANSQNRLLRGIMTITGQQSVSWDGKDNSGNFFPVGSNYKVSVRTFGGEYHFPLLDAENNFTGGPTITMLNATNPIGNTRAFYDDRGYKTIGGTQIGTSGQVLCGINPPNPTFSDPINGFDTASNDRKFGQSGSAGNAGTSCNGSFGDTKALDLWTYYPGQTQPTPLNIIDIVSPNVGKVIINEVLYRETGTATSTNDEFIELYNPSASPVDLSGLKLADGHLTANDNDSTNGFTYTFPNGTTLQAGQYAVIWIGDNNANHQATAAAFQAWLGQTPKLNNSGDDIWLYDNQNKIIDYIAYGGGSEVNTPPASVLNLWDNTYQSSLAGANVGQSISLTPNGKDTNISACWEASTSGNASTRCPNYLPTRDTDTIGSRVTSVGENNNGATAANAKLLLVKRITRINNQDITDIVDGRSDVAVTAANYVPEPFASDDNYVTWPAGYLRGLINAGTVKPGDELEYTIYFLSKGPSDATNVKFCDLVPSSTTFIPTAFNGNTPGDGGLTVGDRGIALALGSSSPTVYLTNIDDASDRGRFYAVNDPTPSYCGTNTNGAVVVNITRSPDLPKLVKDFYGFVRFRAKVK
ncbi:MULTISPECIES: lamin tail domain-containing protein [Nostoc cyanobionts]|uniref:lamin tail domain-containing protein n=1 Tax=Nostoc cyanobionts TaxID=3123326 RepID=UPI000CF34A2A|nr:MULTISPECIES: lamin tail domain-containing protein [unclassified Nostoc]AVH65313.1 lamin-tail domain protein [Nostoc sp. 'Peltigera membranacea cyanobiont' N6]